MNSCTRVAPVKRVLQRPHGTADTVVPRDGGFSGRENSKRTTRTSVFANPGSRGGRPFSIGCSRIRRSSVLCLCTVARAPFLSSCCPHPRPWIAIYGQGSPALTPTTLPRWRGGWRLALFFLPFLTKEKKNQLFSVGAWAVESGHAPGRPTRGERRRALVRCRQNVGQRPL